MAYFPVDLALSADKLGICLLTASANKWSARFLRSSDLHIADPIDPRGVAKSIAVFCKKEGVRVLFDRWASRRGRTRTVNCSIAAPLRRNLPRRARSSTAGVVRPGNFLPFARFSIEVFDFLVREFGAHLAESPRIIAPSSGFLALESFPTSAWRSLGLKPLPGKGKSKPFDVDKGTAQLQQLYNLALSSHPTHDELQALVAALAGPPILNGDPSGYRADGAAPVTKNGVRVEGYIVNPVRPHSVSAST